MWKGHWEEEFDEDIKGDDELLMVSKEMKSPDNNTEPIVKIDDEKCKADNVGWSNWCNS